MAALAANGDSVVEDVKYIQRGYEDFVQKLKQLGGMIETVDSAEEAQKFLLKQA